MALINEEKDKFIDMLCLKFRKVLQLQEKIIREASITPVLGMHRRGEFHLLVGNVKTSKIHELAKILKCRFDKATSSQGFLKYVTYIDGIQFTVHTTECFHGGVPIVKSYPRTKAICPSKKGEESIGFDK